MPISPKVTQVYGQPVLQKLMSITVVQGQTAAIQWVMRDADGNPIDLTPYLAATITLRISEAVAAGSTLNYIDITGTIVDAVNGVIGATLTADVVGYAGISYGEFAFRDINNNVIISNKFYLIVEFGQFGQSTSRMGPPTLAEIRLHIRDNAAEDNYLLDEYEFDAAEIAASIVRPVEQFNAMPPPILQSYNTSNFPWRYPWLEAIVANLYMTAAAHYRRNHLSYSAAGVNVDDKNKEQQYLQAAMLHKKNWDQWAKMQKVNLNMENGWGLIPSGYSFGMPI